MLVLLLFLVQGSVNVGEGVEIGAMCDHYAFHLFYRLFLLMLFFMLFLVCFLTIVFDK